MDGVKSTCKSTCGDGVKAFDEQCDDFGVAPNDGCSPLCKIELGYICTIDTNLKSICKSTCEDGIKAYDEDCDDGNMANGDGCTGCKIDNNYLCSLT